MEICMCLDSCCANFANISTVHICIPLLSIWMLYILLIGTILELFQSLKRSVLWFTLLAKHLFFHHLHMVYTEYQHFAFRSIILVSIPRRSVRDRYCLPYLPHTKSNQQRVDKLQTPPLAESICVTGKTCQMWSLSSTELKRRCRQYQGQMA